MPRVKGYHNIPMTTLWREYTKRTQRNPERVVRPQPRQNLTHDASTLTSFMRPDAPDLMETAAFGHRKCSATKATSSSLALPSTGGDFTFASQVPSGACIREEARALGFTLICMSTVAISAYGLTSASDGRRLRRIDLQAAVRWLVTALHRSALFSLAG